MEQLKVNISCHGHNFGKPPWHCIDGLYIKAFFVTEILGKLAVIEGGAYSAGIEKSAFACWRWPSETNHRQIFKTAITLALRCRGNPPGRPYVGM
jgi:hypothetical protein